ncbi:hypothetical protein [Paenibacillus sp. FSL P4-0502]|uniref:hypothetical protein n=1 Tax=Paenibacillus sp. FSL P4-0502 TaxID=2975319 RepID=UPI0030F79A18
MIKMSLLENGVDSLKSSYLIMEKIPELQEGLSHNIKDAVISLNHGIEILFKLVLKEINEYLVFTDLDNYMLAKKKMLSENMRNVFEAKPGLKTVSLNEAMRRARYLCGIEINSDLETVINYLNKKRNEFMHYEIHLSEEEMMELLSKLRVGYELSVQFFGLHIEGLEELIRGARYEITVEDYSDELAAMYGEMQYDEWRDSQVDDDYHWESR